LFRNTSEYISRNLIKFEFLDRIADTAPNSDIALYDTLKKVGMDPGDAKNTLFDKEPPPFVYINGYAGVGKFTIAKSLVPLLPQPTKLVHNHLLIEPVAAIFGRTSSEYQPLRKSVRQLMLSTICNSEELNSSILVFTDQQSSSPLGSSVAMEYHAAALKRKSRFFSIRLQCKEDEHLRRATSEDRLRSAFTKLTDESLIKRMRNNEDIYKFSGDDELTIDVTDLSPNEAAQRISEFVQSRLAISSDRRGTQFDPLPDHDINLLY
jgi:adenylylsulfate kinase-like enzyme